MAFQFRRGTDAQRLTITPGEGEPLYATDTHALYVGDGTTMGGIQISGGGGSTSTLVNGSYTAQLDTSGNFNANMFLALEGGPGTNPPDGHHAGYSFQGDGGYDTGMFSNGDGELQWYGNGQEVFSTTPNYFQLHKYIDMNGQDITSLNQITFGDSTVQTTAYTLTTTSDVTFNSADISTSITFGPDTLGYSTFFHRAKLEVASSGGVAGNVSITVPNAASTITNALVITNGSEYYPQFHYFDGITLTNSGPSDLILGSGNEYISASKDGNIYFGTANSDGKLNYHYQWKLSNTGTMYFPDSTAQITAWAGLVNAGAQTLGGNLNANGYTINNVPTITGGGVTNSIQIMSSSSGINSLFLTDQISGLGSSVSALFLDNTQAFILNPVQVQLQLGSTGSNRWTFDTDAMTFPDSSVQTTAWTGTSHILSNGTATVTLNSNGPLELSPNTYISFDPPNPEGQVFYIGILPGGEESATTSSFIYTGGEADFNITVNGNIWFFDRAGNLTLPNGGLITDSNDYNEGLLIKASTANNDPIHLETNSTNTWTFALDGSLTLPGNLTFPDLTVQTTAYTTATNGQTTIYARNALPAGIPGMIITISDSGSDTNSPSGNWAPAYWDNDAGLWTYIGNSNSVIAD